MKRTFLYLVFVVLLSCGESEEDVVIRDVNLQNLETIQLYEEQIEESLQSLDLLIYSWNYYRNKERIEYNEKKMKIINSFYNTKIDSLKEIVGIINNQSTINSSNLIKIQELLNFELDTFKNLFTETELGKFSYMQQSFNESFDKFNEIHQVYEFNLFEQKAKDLSKEFTILITNNYIIQLLKEELRLMIFFSSQIGHGSCGYKSTEFLGIIEKNIVLPNDSNSIIMSLQHVTYASDFYVNEQLIEHSYFEPFIYYRFKSPSKPGIYSFNLKVEFMNPDGTIASIEKKVDYQVVNSYQ